jgi:hypothetical protein
MLMKQYRKGFDHSLSNTKEKLLLGKYLKPLNTTSSKNCGTKKQSFRIKIFL